MNLPPQINKSIHQDGELFLTWMEANTKGKIPKEVSKEGAGEKRIPFAHYANSLPVYLTFKAILKNSPLKNAKILDLGCGTGISISYVKDILNKKGYEFKGIDYSKGCIKYAKAQYKKQGVIFKNHDGKILPFEKNTFDFVISSHVIEHIEKKDVFDFFSEISRVLKKNGVAVIGTPNRKLCQDLFVKNSKDIKKYRLIIPHLHEYYYKELYMLLKGHSWFKKYEIYQTKNKINRTLMRNSINKIKPGKGILNKLKFEMYNFFRQNVMLQAIMAKIGTEFVLRKMNFSYSDLVNDTYLYKSNIDKGENFIIIVQK